MRPSVLALVLLCPTLPGLRAQVGLGGLVEVAKSRAERARPEQEKKLEPFWADLSLDYRDNSQVVDERVRQVAALGDSVIPLLLEKVQEAKNGGAARNLASNCSRVLEQLDPASFVDALAELLNNRNDLTRYEAIRLLGYAITPQAERLLISLLDRTEGHELRAVLGALRRHGTPRAAEQVATKLASNDRKIREAALECLIAAKAGGVVETVVQSLSVEQDQSLLPYYIDYFATSVRAHDGAARALLGLFGDRLDLRDRFDVVRALATVAPPDHDPTRRRLRELLDAEQTSALAVQTAVTLRALGDKQATDRLRRLLTAELQKPKRKHEVSLLEQRANLLFAIEDYPRAADDFEKIIEYSRSHAMTRKAYIGLARCKAYERRWSHLIKVLEDSGLLVAEIRAYAAGDDRMQEALEHDKVRSFLKRLARKQAPK